MARFEPLITARLRLRRLTADDAPAVAAYRSLPAIARYQSWQPADAEVGPLTTWFARHADSDADTPDRAGLLVAITLLATGELVGDCTLRVHGQEPYTAEMGYSLAPAHHHHGYATEAVSALCAWALAAPTLGRVVAVVDVRNRPSIAVLERVGMRRIAVVETKLRGQPTRALWYQLSRPDAPDAPAAPAAIRGA